MQKNCFIALNRMAARAKIAKRKYCMASPLKLMAQNKLQKCISYDPSPKISKMHC